MLRVAGTLALALGAPLLLLGALEAVAWALDIEPLADSPHRLAREEIRSCRWSPEHLALCQVERPRKKALGRTSVFVLGGSSVVGHPGGETRNIPHYLKARLQRRAHGRFFVQSFARPCKDSIYVRACSERLLDLPADFLVIYSGHNDFSGHTSRRPRLSIWIARHGWPLLELETWLARFRFWSLLSRAEAQPLLPAFDPGFGLTPEARSEMNQVILDHYTENLTAIIERAREQGTQVILVTVVSNLHEYPHRREKWNLALAAAGRTEDPPAALAHFESGIRHFRAGRHEAALEAFVASRDADPKTRAPSILDRRIRELAATHDHVHLVDFEQELAQTGLAEGIGCNYFGTDEYCDGVHINPNTSRRIGEAVADQVMVLWKLRGRQRPARPPVGSGG